MPLLVAVFGTVPLASLPANVAAGPASAPVMMWGLTGGLGAGLAGGWTAWLIHRPTAALLWWMRTVAESAAAAPAAMLGAGGAVAVALGVVLVLMARRRDRATSTVQRHHDTDPCADAGPGMWRRRAVKAVGSAVLLVAFGSQCGLTAASPPQGWSEVVGSQAVPPRDGRCRL